MAPPENYLITDVRAAELTAAQLYGLACVFCRRTEALEYAGWVRSPLSPGRYLSAPVAACGRCRDARARPQGAVAPRRLPAAGPPSAITALPSVDGPFHP